MTVFPWSDNYLIGVESLDEQHRALVQEVARIDRQIAAQVPFAEMCDMIDALHWQTELHFRHEESLFDGTRFHRARAHKREHQGLLLILRRFRQSLDERRLAAAPDDHIRFLRDWLINHIRREDYVMGVHLNSLSKR